MKREDTIGLQVLLMYIGMSTLRSQTCRVERLSISTRWMVLQIFFVERPQRKMKIKAMFVSFIENKGMK